MAIRRITFLEDDLDGSKADETVVFAVDGFSYEIELNAAHASELRAAIRPYAGVARKIPSSRGITRPARDKAGASSSQIRAWAKEQGLNINSRGRIQADVVEKYQAAH
jgi:hypothetical protein